MYCNSKRICTFLTASILTFVFSVGLTMIWQSSTQNVYNELDFVNTELPERQINPRVENPAIYWRDKIDPCEELKGVRGYGGKAFNKMPANVGVLNGKSCFVEPVYSKEAIEKNIFGDVNVEVRVDGYGIVRSAKAVSGDELLRQSAVEAAYNTKVIPIWLRGEPVNVKGLIVYKFVL